MRLRLTAMLLCLCPCAAFGTDPLPLPIEPGGAAVNLSPHTAWIEDRGATLTLQHALAATEYRLNTEPVLNPGVSGAVIWAKTTLSNAGKRSGEWVLVLNRSSLEVCEIYVRRGDRVETLFDGELSSYVASFNRFGTLAAGFVLAPDEQADLYVRYQGSNWSALDLWLYDPSELQTKRQRSLALFLVLLGIVASLTIYGALSITFLGWRVVGLYILAQVSFFVFFAHLSSFTTIYLWPESPQAGRALSPIALTLYIVAMAGFARAFFELRERLPLIDRLLQSCRVTAVVALALVPVEWWAGFDRQVSLIALYLVTIVTWIVLPALGGYATWRWNRSYWPLFAGWVSMGLFAVAMVMVFIGVLPTLPLGKDTYLLFVGLESTFLALAVGLRFRDMRAELAGTERRLRDALRAQLRAAEQREWALQDLAEKGRLLLATGHDSKQMLFALRALAGRLRPQAGADAEQLDDIAEHLEGVFGTAVSASYSGGIEDDVVCLDSIHFEDLTRPLEMIYAEQARKRNVELRCTESFAVFATDKVLVLRALSNLVNNALVHARPSRILVGLRDHADAIRLQVFDDGTGIEAERLQALLAPGSKLASGTDASYGAGVGLNIVKHLAIRLGGELRAASAPGRGSCFELYLPKADGDLEGILVGLEDADPHTRGVIDLVCAAAGAKLVDAAAPRTDVRFVEQARLPATRPGRGAIVALTYDRSATQRAELASRCTLILYKPLDGLQVRSALHHAIGAGHHSPAAGAAPASAD